MIYDINSINMKDFLEESTASQVKYPNELSFLNPTKFGTVNLVCAKTGVGKSWFLSQFACCINENYPVLYISLENDVSTDFERLDMMKTLYPYLGTTNPFCYVNGSTMTTPEYKQSWLKNKELFRAFPIVCIDGFETTVDCDGNANMSEVYKAGVKEIRTKFPEACIWMSWQMGRKFETTVPTAEDVAYSYSAMRIAYSAVAIYKDKAGNRITTNIKSRGKYNDDSAILRWGQHFTSQNTASNQLGDLLTQLGTI